MPNPMKNPTQTGANDDPATQTSDLSGISGSTACNMHHLCCYLRRPLPLTPPQHKKHIKKLILSAISAFESPSLSTIKLQTALTILSSAVSYANFHRLHSHEAKAQLWRGHVLLKLGYPAEASWCATRAFGWVEKGTGVKGKGQRWAASLKIEAERAGAELPDGDERKVVREGFETVPGTESGVVAASRARRAREAQVKLRRVSNVASLRQNDKALSESPSHFSWSSVGEESPLSFRHRMSMMMHKEHVLTLPKSQRNGSFGGRTSPASIPHIGPAKVAIVHTEGGELWKIGGPRSSLVVGNKDSRRTLHVVNKPDPDPLSRWTIAEDEMEAEGGSYTP